MQSPSFHQVLITTEPASIRNFDTMDTEMEAGGKQQSKLHTVKQKQKGRDEERYNTTGQVFKCAYK